ncbi:hypothetical protein IWQ60_009671 [Tieghemiomyces parasiticus]|uniref:Uncharacterized protein n=1 Tax=Tieghemiomyces parasiticus TaxID=78921 RepID=A0A9W7ZSI2_9FUNG|nr:hypothetical protein IWQ60_009671 [Tieghemiomyces parasiticus]
MQRTDSQPARPVIGGGDDRSLRTLTILRTVAALRLSVNCPFPEQRLRWSHYLGRLEQQGYLIPQPLNASPSFFIPQRFLVRLPLPTPQTLRPAVSPAPFERSSQPPLFRPDPALPILEDGLDCSPESRKAVQSLYCSQGLVTNLGRVFMFNPEFLIETFINITEEMRTAGPLPRAVVYYLAMMAGAELQCYYSVSLFQREFIRSEGTLSWLDGLHRAPPKIQALGYLNSLLAKRPWSISAEHFDLLSRGCCDIQAMRAATHRRERVLFRSGYDAERGPGDQYGSPVPMLVPGVALPADGARVVADSWSAADLCHAVFVLTTCQSFSALALSCGVVPEVDVPGGFVITTGTRDEVASPGTQCARQARAAAELAADPFFNHIAQQVDEYLFINPATRVLVRPCEPPSSLPRAADAPVTDGATWRLLSALRHQSEGLNLRPVSPLGVSLPELLDACPAPGSPPAERHRDLTFPLLSQSAGSIGISDPIFAMDDLTVVHHPTHHHHRSQPFDVPTRPSADHLATGYVTAPASDIQSIIPGPVTVAVPSLAACTSEDGTVTSSTSPVPRPVPLLPPGVIDVANTHHSSFTPLKRYTLECRRFALPPEQQVRQHDHPVHLVGPADVFQHDLSWENDGHWRLAEHLPQHAERVHRELYVISHCTDGTLGSHVNYGDLDTPWTAGDDAEMSAVIDTRPFREAVWRYTQTLFGIHVSDYAYDDLRHYLSEDLQRYIRKVACHSHLVTPHDFHGEMGSCFRIDETCHINLIVCQAKRCAAMVLALRKLSK